VNRTAYVVARYPAVSHTFVLREVLALRRRGIDVNTISIRRTEPEDLLSSVDRGEAARTFNVLPASAGAIAGAHVRTAARAPGAYLQTLALALRLSPPGVRGTLWQLFYFAEAMIVALHCQAEGVRHLHAHLANVAADVALLAARYGGMTWSFTMHGPTEFYDVREHRLPEKTRDADLVFCISDFARSQLMGMVEPEYWNKLEIVHCGVDPGEFAPAPRSTRNDVTVLCVGRLVSVKGQGVLLEALARTSNDVRAEFVGDGPERARLERRACELGLDERVTFHGAVGQDRIRDLYAAADVFCLPSFAEGVPVVLMEAMAMNIPVVTCGVMGIPELVEHNVSGLLVPPGRVEPLADALMQLAGDTALRRRLGEGGRAKVQREFTVDESAERLEDLFRRLAV
jgi:glycosyltransferase involved in cell wall biosynthesis